MKQSMNIYELIVQLDMLGIDPQCYCINGSFPNEQYVLTHLHGDIWCFYYAERGQRSGLREFTSEAEACVFFLDLLKRHKTTRLKPSDARLVEERLGMIA